MSRLPLPESTGMAAAYKKAYKKEGYSKTSNGN